MDRLRLLALAASLACALVATLALAQPADVAAGALLHDKDCVACHIRRVGGDGTAMYTRAERRVTTVDKLRAQVAVCNSELSTGWFPDEEAHVAAYLNLRYYKLKE